MVGTRTKWSEEDEEDEEEEEAAAAAAEKTLGIMLLMLGVLCPS
jgi:hypothetical protein